MKKGKVYLVGAGPGDPGLLTVKGLECLRHADVVIYDRLVDTRILREASPRAEKIYVGKAANQDSWNQEAVNELLLKKASQGKRVVRLKGGDPFVFGRGGEEAELLAGNEIPFEVVPGVSSAFAVPAYAGIPVTHRKYASSFTVVTGHEACEKSDSSIPWQELPNGAETLVVLMGMANLSNVVGQLIKNNRSPSTPVAVISHGTSHRQRCVTGTLKDIVAKVESGGLQPPGVVVVGQVARLRDQLCWFDNQPLLGKRVLVVASVQQSNQLSQLLRGCGALPVELPILEVELAPNSEELDQAVRNLEDYQWLIFTSIDGVEAFFQRLFTQNHDVRRLVHLRVGAIGPTTAKALEERGVKADYVPLKYSVKGFLGGLTRKDLGGCRVLLPRSDRAGKMLAAGLARLGAQVHEVVAYRTIVNVEAVSEGKQLLSSGEVDVVSFTNPSTVAHFVSALKMEVDVVNRALVACIGPKTEAAASKAGLRVDIVAREHTVRGLLEAMEGHFRTGDGAEG